MDRSKVFISYSHRDDKALEQLRRYLRPLERREKVEYWDDTRLAGGDDWRAEIERALAESTAAVLLVSQDFIASDFITDEEVPRVLARADAGELTVVPVFLADSLVADVDYTFRDAAGETKKKKLTELQGYGSPGKKSTWSQREKVFKKLAQRLVEFTDTASPKAKPAVPRPLRTVQVTPEPARDDVLTVYLERRGAELRLEYSLPDTEAVKKATTAWSEVEERAVRIDAALRDGRLPSETGRLLFEIVFGDETRWEPVLRRLFNRMPPKPRPNPTWAPARLRLATHEPLLLRLPWHLTTWKTYALVERGWTFTVTDRVDPTDDLATTAPASVLLLVGDDDHATALADLFRQVWPTGRDPGYLRRVTGHEAILGALGSMRPHLVYVQGDLADAAALPELFRRAEHRPEVVCLNTGRDDDFAALVGAAPLVVGRRSGHPGRSTLWALAWLRRWLEKGEDPVAALAAAIRHDVADPLERASLVVYSSYRAWRTAIFRAFDRERLPKLRLDRDHQKALVAKHVGELARSDSRRVMALLAYAEPGQSVADLGEQLRHHLELELFDRADFEWLHLEFPPIRRAELRQDLEGDLRGLLRAEEAEHPGHLLRRWAPRAVRAGKRAILWLDWGTFGDGHQEPLKPGQLEDWLRFASEYLGTHCPEDLRVVAFAALETRDAKRLGRVIQGYHRQPWCFRTMFRLNVLPPLEKVSEVHLLEFLADGHSSCDPPLYAEMSDRLVTATGGVFEETVALMEEAERGSWYDLRDRLRHEQGVPVPEDDEEPL